MNSNATTRRIRSVALWLIPTILFVFIVLAVFSRKSFFFLLREDGWIEWFTFAGLIISGIYALKIALGIRRRHHYNHWFFFLFFAFALLAGLEEISWGQRVFGIESNEFFQKYNGQKETNLHNTFQLVTGIKTKHVALLVLFVYGVVFPWLLRKGKLQLQLIKNKQFIIPPFFLIPAYFITSMVMIDYPFGLQEELGEFFYSICFVLMNLYNYELFKAGRFAKAAPSDKLSKAA